MGQMELHGGLCQALPCRQGPGGCQGMQRSWPDSSSPRGRIWPESPCSGSAAATVPPSLCPSVPRPVAKMIPPTYPHRHTSAISKELLFSICYLFTHRKSRRFSPKGFLGSQPIANAPQANLQSSPLSQHPSSTLQEMIHLMLPIASIPCHHAFTMAASTSGRGKT